jgi:hypothetical protein
MKQKAEFCFLIFHFFSPLSFMDLSTIWLLLERLASLRFLQNLSPLPNLHTNRDVNPHYEGNTVAK